MSGLATLSRSTTVDVPPERAFSETLILPLPTLFSTWFGPIPPIRDVLDQTGDWQSAGQTRTILLAGGGQMAESLLEVSAPSHFAYRLDDIRGPMAPLASHIDGRWTFTPSGAGTTITWHWEVHARSAASRPILPVFGRLWNGYAKRSLARLESLISAG